jgi:hypothetical protein
VAAHTSFYDSRIYPEGVSPCNSRLYISCTVIATKFLDGRSLISLAQRIRLVRRRFRDLIEFFRPLSNLISVTLLVTFRRKNKGLESLV